MAVTFTNIWRDKILGVVESILETEFGGELKVYISDNYHPTGNLSIRLFASGQSLEDYSTDSFTNEYEVEISYYLVATNFSGRITDKFFNDVSRIEQLLFNNKNQTQPNAWFTGRIQNVEINQKNASEADIDNLLVARINFVCNYQHVS